MPLGPTMVTPASACATAMLPVPLERRVVVHVAVVGEHAAVAVVRVFVQAQVADHHVLVAELVVQHRERALRDAVRVRCLGTFGVLVLRHREHHERRDPSRRDVDGFLAQRFERVLELARHRRDRDGVGDALLDEQRRDQLPGSQIGLADQRAERRRAAHPSRPLLGEAHARDSTYDAPRTRSSAATSPSIVCGRATAETRRPCARASAAVTGPDRDDLGVAPDHAHRADEPADRRRARERDGVDVSVTERRARVGGQRSRHPRAVGVDALGRPPLRGERILQARRCDVGARAQHASFASGERARQTDGREGRRHEVGLPPRPGAERRARALADRGDVRADVLRVVQPRRQHLDRRAAGQRDPRELPGRQLAHRTRERGGPDRCDLDGGGDDRAGAQGSDAADELDGLVGGSRHQHGPAGERPHPRSSLASPSNASSSRASRISSAPSAMSSFVASAAAPSGESDTTSTRAIARAVGSDDDREHLDAGAVHRGDRAERQRTAPAEPPHQRALGLERGPALEVIERRERRERWQIVRARLERERALSRRGNHHIRARAARSGAA